MVGFPTFVKRSFRLQLREQDHVADAFLAAEHYAQTVNADAVGDGRFLDRPEQAWLPRYD
jgi:hypothetical protein